MVYVSMTPMGVSSSNGLAMLLHWLTSEALPKYSLAYRLLVEEAALAIADLAGDALR